MNNLEKIIDVFILPAKILIDWTKVYPLIIIFYVWALGVSWSIFTERDSFLGSFIWFIPFNWRMKK